MGAAPRPHHGRGPRVRRANAPRPEPNLVMLLAKHREGELIRVSDFHDVLRERGASIERTIEILTGMGILADDRPALSTFERWLAGKLDGLAPGIRPETERWARRCATAAPATQPESQKRRELSEGRAGPRCCVVRALTATCARSPATSPGPRRRAARQPTRMTSVALRSLFTWAKKNVVIFRNPASQDPAQRLEPVVWQPLPPEIDAHDPGRTTPQGPALRGAGRRPRGQVHANPRPAARGRRPPRPAASPSPAHTTARRPHPPAAAVARPPPPTMAEHRQQAPAHQRQDRNRARTGQRPWAGILRG